MSFNMNFHEMKLRNVITFPDNV